MSQVPSVSRYKQTTSHHHSRIQRLKSNHIALSAIARRKAARQTVVITPAPPQVQITDESEDAQEAPEVPAKRRRKGRSAAAAAAISVDVDPAAGETTATTEISISIEKRTEAPAEPQPRLERSVQSACPFLYLPCSASGPKVRVALKCE